ncbi:MAG: Homospermidine synthase (Spermidine-specific) [Candidatus Moranbacteria bacterium GW2011_GWC1_45_18]|nr:MAG: Homospermidine synthase (Spermidine-specific) [Candidatus Moranbacteria bacterium GW2011_GWC2_40_12]KKT32755.1 MAG: Homospermidine synthase (Spermidine-specific) [Candidatus Moranbacteria bacterium GW2011_GWF2_44_10]KKT99143.1 MAG: Homospermidine synthase (Spermidine-specific) [Candidatus Moranbacteria bacterium GW2011_GWC1_45_18]HBB37519.1 deoxyhypusine synthase [Candidatus Moranbacteria bacterium]HBU24641.1 deoxyhypusine synthase [Candidatus Moranbacteria bacterium]
MKEKKSKFKKIDEAYETKRDLKHDGFSDNLKPISSLDLGKAGNVDELVRGMSKTAFGGRNLGEAADVLEAMVRDKDCFVVLTLSGAMTVAKMGLLICDMIDRGMVNAVVSTGALMTHGMVEGFGMSHFKYDEEMDDEKLYACGYNRVYDTLELEKNLDDLELIVFEVFKSLDHKKVYSSNEILNEVGKYLQKNTDKERAILKSAYEKKVPIYIPAFTDSEFFLDIGIFNRRQKLEKKPILNTSEYLDLEHFTELIKKQKKIGIFTIGGGVPRNWAQQVTCYLDLIGKRVGVGGKFLRYSYGVRISPEPVHWGGLSGCTYSEGVSWGKMVPPKEGGRFAEVYCDATIAWPIILKAVMERLDKKSGK